MAGVVVREESVAGHAREFTMVLADGRRVTVDPSSSTQLLPLEPRVGDLALVGSVPKPWYGGVPPFAPGNCFSTTGNKVQDAGGFIEFGTYRNDGAWVWIRVPKAAHFNPGPLPSGGSTETHGGLCLDDQGRAISLM